MLYDKPTKQLGVRVSVEIYDEIQRVCTKYNITISEFLRKAIMEYIVRFQQEVTMVGLGIIIILALFANLLITAGAAQALLDQHEEFYKREVLTKLDELNNILDEML